MKSIIMSEERRRVGIVSPLHHPLSLPSRCRVVAVIYSTKSAVWTNQTTLQTSKIHPHKCAGVAK